MAGSMIGLNLDSCAGVGDAAIVTDQQLSELVEKLPAGVEEAYEILIARFEQPVYNLIFRLLNGSSSCADVTQEVFLKVFRNIGNFRGDSSLKTWVYRIAVNEAYNHRRWFSRHRRQEIDLEAEDDHTRSYRDSLCDQGQSPYELALIEERHVLVGEALNDLNPIFRTAVVLRDIEDLSYEEIAEIMQVSLGTVKSRILRGREALRRSLAARLAAKTAMDWSPQPAE